MRARGGDGEVPDVIVVGDVMADVVVSADSIAAGGDVDGEVRIRPGGAGANVAVWAAAAGARVRLHGRVGDDLAGRLLADALAERGVETALVRDPSAPTGAMLVLRSAGERSMVAGRGANANLAPADLPTVLEARGAVLVSAYPLLHPGSEAAARAALTRARAPHVAVDAASWPLVRHFGPARFLEAIAPATVLFANAREAAVLSGADPAAAAAALAERVGMACVKLGNEGAIMAEMSAGGVATTRRGADPVVEVDPTGAGDAFDGALLAALARGAGHEDALAEACRAGARAAAGAEAWPEPPRRSDGS